MNLPIKTAYPSAFFKKKNFAKSLASFLVIFSLLFNQASFSFVLFQHRQALASDLNQAQQEEGDSGESSTKDRSKEEDGDKNNNEEDDDKEENSREKSSDDPNNNNEEESSTQKQESRTNQEKIDESDVESEKETPEEDVSEEECSNSENIKKESNDSKDSSCDEADQEKEATDENKKIIENKNEAEVTNESKSDSDTGGNKITNEDSAENDSEEVSEIFENEEDSSSDKNNNKNSASTEAKESEKTLYYDYQTSPDKKPVLQAVYSTGKDNPYGPEEEIRITAEYDEIITKGEITFLLNTGAEVTLTEIDENRISGIYTVGETGSEENTKNLKISSMQEQNICNTDKDCQTDTTLPENNISDDSGIIVDTAPPEFSNLDSHPSYEVNEDLQELTITVSSKETEEKESVEEEEKIEKEETNEEEFVCTLEGDYLEKGSHQIDFQDCQEEISQPSTKKPSFLFSGVDIAGNLGETSFEEKIKEESDKEEESTEDQGSKEDDANNEEEESNQEQEIETGQAIAQSDIFNELNVNITGENWEDVVINLYDNHQKDVNLLKVIDEIVENEYLSQEEIDTIVNNENLAIAENNASSSANSGENKIEEADGESKINTGDALAKANIVNVINKNIVGNNWVFALINVFGDWEGDLVIPGENLLKFKNMLTNNDIKIKNKNEADIENFSEAEANTGENSIENSESTNIQTGDSQTQSDVFNQVNTNINENGWFSLKINNLGSWNGAVQDWDGDISNNLLFNYLIGAENEIESDSKLEVNNNNDAQVTNTASAEANTGNNSADGGEDSSITTGDASAYTNIANLVNLNFIGNNWFYTAINIMGSWSGNLVFAYPDLEISISDNKETADPGNKNIYQVSYFNKGRAAAKDVSVFVHLPEDVNSEYPGQKYQLPINKIPAGQGASFEIETAIKNQDQITNNLLEAKAVITTETTEKNEENNEAIDQTKINSINKNENDNHKEEDNKADSESNLPPIKTLQSQPQKENNTLTTQFPKEKQGKAELKISREKNKELTLSPGNPLSHQITIENDGDAPIYDIKVKDEMSYLKKDKSEIAEYEWEIGYLEKGEAVLIEYQILINDMTPVGDYQFSAIAKGLDIQGEKVESNKSSMSLKIIPPPAPIYERPNEDSAKNSQENKQSKTTKTAQASEGEFVPVLAASISQKPPLPLWIWISALIAYGLAINWAIFPYGNPASPQKQKTFRLTAGVSLSSALFFAFWFSYQSNEYLWVPLAALLILTLHVYYKYFSLPKSAFFSSLLRK